MIALWVVAKVRHTAVAPSIAWSGESSVVHFHHLTRWTIGYRATVTQEAGR
ncbi:MAG: hypothetical protein KME05_23615 [Gloeocapsa sp. UFS-A4-WI-NPMV-4B04]|nr:hypothetical protein [Gloeocapsa sp. UFS-A4-WI-NPMV-4B04]